MMWRYWKCTCHAVGCFLFVFLLLFLLLLFHWGKFRNSSVLVCQLSDFSDALGIPIFHYIKYKKMYLHLRSPLVACSDVYLTSHVLVSSWLLLSLYLMLWLENLLSFKFVYLFLNLLVMVCKCIFLTWLLKEATSAFTNTFLPALTHWGLDYWVTIIGLCKSCIYCT